MKKYFFLFVVLSFFPAFAFASEDCSVYTSTITKLQSEILDLNYSYNHVRENLEPKFAGSGITGNRMNLEVQSEQNRIAVQISDKNIEIERQKLKYNACIQANYQEEVSNYNQAITKQAQVSEEIKKIQEQDAYYAQKAKEDTAKLQAQIETDKKAKELANIKNVKLTKIEQNKKRIADIRKKAEERRKKLAESKKKK